VIPEKQEGALAAYLSDCLGTPCCIVSSRRMSMGQSRAMYVVELDCEGGGQRTLVIRVEQWGLLGTDSQDEVRIMQALHAAGYPIAEVLAYDPTNRILGQPFFVMDFVPGTSVYTRASLDPFVAALDRMHRMDPVEVKLDFLETPCGPRDPALLQVERWYQIYRGGLIGEPSPLIEEAAEWLRNNAPSSERVTLVHGDPGPGNYLHADDVLTAVVDWEFTHIGDPSEDWAYLISMRGMGVMGEDSWLKYIHEQVGVELDRESLRYWHALNFFKAVCIDQTALGCFAERVNLAPNMLAIGTAVQLSALKRLAEAVLYQDHQDHQHH
jgi:aminoglycoside phosphotransferase (APT) family kinase protein